MDYRVAIKIFIGRFIGGTVACRHLAVAFENRKQVFTREKKTVCLGDPSVLKTTARQTALFGKAKTSDSDWGTSVFLKDWTVEKDSVGQISPRHVQRSSQRDHVHCIVQQFGIVSCSFYMNFLDLLVLSSKTHPALSLGIYSDSFVLATASRFSWR